MGRRRRCRPGAIARGYAGRVLALHLRTVDAACIPAEDLTTGTPDVAALLDAIPDFAGWFVLELWHPAPHHDGVSFLEANARSADLVRRVAARGTAR